MQCAMGAMAAGSAATGLRAWLAARRPRWLGPARLRGATLALVGAATAAAATLVG